MIRATGGRVRPDVPDSGARGLQRPLDATVSLSHVPDTRLVS